MPWLNVDDKMGEHPKADQAGNAALGLWLRLATYCARMETDGRVSKTKAAQYGTPAELRALIKAGLVERTRDGYQLHDWTDWNRRKELLDKDREAARLRMAAVRADRKSSAEQSANGSDELTGNFDGIARPVQRPTTTSSYRTRGGRRKASAPTNNVTPIDLPRCDIHLEQGRVCRGCAADRKAGNA